MSRIFFAGHDRGAGQLPTLGFPRPAYGADTAPPFLCLSGAHFQQSTRIYGTPLRPAVHAYYLRTCGLHPPPAWERAESVCADFAVRHGGTFSFSNSSSKTILYVTYPKLSGPFVEFHKAIFWVGGWDPYSLPLFSNRSSKTIICSFSRGSTERCPAVQSGAAELAACARAFGMRLCRAKQEIPPFSRS